MASAQASEDLARLDPRKRRTRVALHRGLEELLERHEFESISVQDIAEASDLNRATFYAHYPDKFALLECMVGSRFGALVENRHISVRDGCAAALSAITLAVYDYLTSSTATRGKRQHQLEPHLEAAIIGAVRRIFLDGLNGHGHERPGVSAELLATTASWALYGAAREWLRSANGGTPEELAALIQTLVGPIFGPPESREPSIAGSERR